jgi:hypothetical protein
MIAPCEAWIQGRKARVAVLIHRKRAGNESPLRSAADREIWAKGVVFAAMRMGVEKGRDR